MRPVSDRGPGPGAADRYRVFAEIEATGQSPSYEEWAIGVAEDPEIIALSDELPEPKRQANLVFAAPPRSSSSGFAMQASAIPVTEVRSIASQIRGTARARGAPSPAENSLARRPASGASSRAVRMRELTAGSTEPPSWLRNRSQQRRPVASARCRSSLATGSAAIAALTAISTPMCGSSLTRPMADGMSGTSSDRAASELQSLTMRASEAITGLVQSGWSLHRSPAR
ncbi:MAG: DUF2332 family protein [Lacisediminihabitans sp.]